MSIRDVEDYVRSAVIPDASPQSPAASADQGNDRSAEIQGDSGLYSLSPDIAHHLVNWVDESSPSPAEVGVSLSATT